MLQQFVLMEELIQKLEISLFHTKLNLYIPVLGIMLALVLTAL